MITAQANASKITLDQMLQQNYYCSYDSNYVAATVSDYNNVDASEDALKSAVADIGPIAIAIDASSSNFQFYAGK